MMINTGFKCHSHICQCPGQLGPLMGGPQCCMSILRNGNVACPCRLLYPMSHFEFKNRLCHMSLYFLGPVACH